MEPSCARATRSHCSNPHSVWFHQSPLAATGRKRVPLHSAARERRRSSAGEFCNVTEDRSGGRSCRMEARGCEEHALTEITGRDGEGLHAKAVRRMCVLKHSAADVVLAHDGADASKCHIQPCRFRQLWREETELHLAGAARLSVSVNARIAACGGCASRSRCSSLIQSCLSFVGSAGRTVRVCVPPPSSVNVMVTEASARTRALHGGSAVRA